MSTAALSGRDYQVEVAGNLTEARRLCTSFRPDVVILDLGLPDGDGFDLLASIKRDRNTSSTSVIVLSGQKETEVKVQALRLGADDYIVKPFDSEELAARVETVLRRRELELAASPTTRLPGGRAIESEVQRRLRQVQPFTLCYLDLDNLKAFNDYYGYSKADAVIQQTGDLLREVVSAHGEPEDFIGHIAGDDFVMIAAPERAPMLARTMIDAFNRLIPLYYSREDREAGYIDGFDRDGNSRRFPIMGISIAGVTEPGGRFDNPADLARRAAEQKKRAKAIVGSVFVPDDGPIGNAAKPKRS